MPGRVRARGGAAVPRAPPAPERGRGLAAGVSAARRAACARRPRAGWCAAGAAPADRLGARPGRGGQLPPGRRAADLHLAGVRDRQPSRTARPGRAALGGTGAARRAGCRSTRRHRGWAARRPAAILPRGRRDWGAAVAAAQSAALPARHSVSQLPCRGPRDGCEIVTCTVIVRPEVRLPPPVCGCSQEAIRGERGGACDTLPDCPAL